MHTVRAQAANYLSVPSLMDLVCAYIASLMRFKKTEQIRAAFNLKNDLSPGDEARLRAETVWARVRPERPAVEGPVASAAAVPAT